MQPFAVRRLGASFRPLPHIAHETISVSFNDFM